MEMTPTTCTRISLILTEAGLGHVEVASDLRHWVQTLIRLKIHSAEGDPAVVALIKALEEGLASVEAASAEEVASFPESGCVLIFFI